MSGNQNLNVEEQRLETFTTWPASAKVEARRVAKGGFYYTGHGEEVKCFSCGGIISEWNYGDQVMARHRVLNPECPFVKNPTDSGNIPLLAPSSSVNSTFESSPGIQRASVETLSGTNGHTGSWDHSTRYRSEAARLESFTTWPIPQIVSPEQLARAGFYYLLESDKVQCAFCSGVVGHWEAGDDPVAEHRRHFPTCPLHFNMAGLNIPLENSETEIGGNVQDTCCTTKLCSVRGGGESNEDVNVAELGIHLHRGPKHPKFSTLESRIRTYDKWPPDLRQRPSELAHAGFYYMGERDQVRCFHCDGGLSHWDPSDEPWVEHARWFPHCSYVKLVKGPEFVAQCLHDRPPLIDPNAQPQPYEVRNVLEEEVENLMSSPPAVAALEMRIDPRRVRTAIKRKLEQTGLPFSTSDALIEAALTVRLSEGNPEGNPMVESVATASTAENAEVCEETSAVMSQSLPSLPHLDDPESNMNDKSSISSKSMPQLTSGQTEDKYDLEEENRRLKEARLCKICMDEEVGVVFLPCGHLATCVNCAPSLQDCPMCRSPIKGSVRTFYD